jgi:MFS family permease
MLIASPIAGLYADRHGSRTLAALGMLVSAAGLAAMTTLQVHTPYWQSGLWLLIVGVGSGMFNSPNTAAMMGAVPAYRRGVAAGARTLAQNTGAVLSIAFVLAIVTSAVPKATLFAVFSGLARGLSEQKLAPFIANMHVALWVLAATSLLGAGVCLMRPRYVTAAGPSTTAAPDGRGMPEARVATLAAGARDFERSERLADHPANASAPSVPAGTR